MLLITMYSILVPGFGTLCQLDKEINPALIPPCQACVPGTSANELAERALYLPLSLNCPACRKYYCRLAYSHLEHTHSEVLNALIIAAIVIC